MALALSSLLTVVTEDEAIDQAIDILQTLGFNSTSWQEGSIQHTLIRLVARLYSGATDVVKQIAELGFNELATGDGLTMLSESHYQNFRVAALETQGVMRLTSTATAPPHTIAVGDLQIATTATAEDTTQTYRNTTGGTLNPGSTLDLTFEAEVAGADGNVPSSTTLYMWTPLVGVSVTNPADALTGTWITQTGIDQESDERLRLRNRSKWATLSYAATDGAYTLWALEALSTVTRVKVRSNNPFGPGTVDVIVASATGGIAAPDLTTILNYIEGTDGTGRRPLNDVVTVNTAVAVTQVVSGTVKVASAYTSSTTIALLQQTLDAYFGTLPIGGTVIPPASTGVMVYSEMVERVMALPGVIAWTPTSPTGDVSLGETEILTGDYAALTVDYV